MKLSNNLIKYNKNIIEKVYLERNRVKREKYFYLKYKNQNLNIPKLIKISKNKIFLKKYKFRKIKSQTLFLNEFLRFLVKINKKKKYNYYAKENLKNYSLLLNQVKKRFEKISYLKIDKKYSKKLLMIKLYIKNIIEESPNSARLNKIKRIISPSDIGFHNCSIYKDKVFFFDFEYAGLDHPIKLICDIYYQPEKKINKKYMLKFIDKLEKNFNFKLPKNFFIFEKLLKVKMMLIILNIFIISNINNKSKKINKSKLRHLKLERLNKVYKYISLPFLYE